MTHQIISAGFGGQGVLLLGQLLAYAGLQEGKNVSWLPSYGPEMRGGTANCNVILSDAPIGSPIVNTPNVLMVMNNPSLDKYESLPSLNPPCHGRHPADSTGSSSRRSRPRRWQWIWECRRLPT